MTSAGEVLCPGGADFIEVLLDQCLNFRNLLWLEAEVRRQLDGRIDPELRFAVSMLNVNVRPQFLAGKEIEPEPFDPQDRRTHKASIAQCRRSALRSGFDGDSEMSGATNEVGAPETGLRFSEPVLTPQADDLHLVLGLVVTARPYPIISCSRVTDRRSCLHLADGTQPNARVSAAAA